jgi:hypothetical protein
MNPPLLTTFMSSREFCSLMRQIEHELLKHGLRRDKRIHAKRDAIASVRLSNGRGSAVG